MKTKIIRVGLLSAALLLGSCAKSERGRVPQVSGPRTAAFISHQLSLGQLVELPVQNPSALLGTYAALFLSGPGSLPVQGAIIGVETQMDLIDRDVARDDAYLLLQDISATLGADLQELLNRSPDRRETLTLYTQSLEDVLERSVIEQERLEAELEETRDEEREKRDAVNDLQRTLRTAINEQDYATASDVQQQIVDAQSDLAAVEAREDELSGTLRIFEEVLETGAERLSAIEANREILIAGQMVVDLPGVEDIGILKSENRRNGSRFLSPFGEL